MGISVSAGKTLVDMALVSMGSKLTFDRSIRICVLVGSDFSCLVLWSPGFASQ